MTKGAARQGRMVSDLNADTQIGVGGWIEIVFISLVRARANSGSSRRATVPQFRRSACCGGAYRTEMAEFHRADLFRKWSRFPIMEWNLNFASRTKKYRTRVTKKP